uniref:Uncharacterized protein n=1 Tax=Pyricularia oryzae (strain P131) TaxID=1143193 RepID=L7JSM8_PYRO1
MKTFVFVGLCLLFGNAMAAKCYCVNRDGSRHNTGTSEVCESSRKVFQDHTTDHYCESSYGESHWNQECKYQGCHGGLCV